MSNLNLTNGNGSLADYAYDLDNNLTALNHQWTGESATLNYAYDNTGLQTGYSSSDDRFAPLFEALGTKTNTPNNLNQYVTAAGQNLTYNGNGALTSDGARTYTYDAANRLLTAQNGQSATYAYDPFDRRRSKTVDSQAVTFIYDGDQIIAEYADSGLVKKFIYGPGIDAPIMMQAGETKYYYHADRLGSIIALADSTGNLVDAYRYSVYGEVDNPGSLGNPFLYTGREYDSETGLYYYRARYYDAALRRFLQPDPIGYLGGMNLYAYVGNDPINWVDPDGLANINLFAPGTILANQTDRWNPAGYYSVSGHGNPRNMIGLNRKTLTVQDLATMIKNDPNFHGQPVYLDSCSTGKGSRSFAERLADELGVPVTAPTDKVIIEDWIIIYRRYINNGGIDKTFFPKK